MGAPLGATIRRLTLARTLAKFAAAWGAMLWVLSHDLAINGIDRFLQDATNNALARFPSPARFAQGVYEDVTTILLLTCFLTLIVATGTAVLGGAARLIARARARAGQADFLDRLRVWTAANPDATRALTLAPALLWTFNLAHALPNWDWLPGAYARALLPLALAGWGVFAMTKKGLRELLAPTLEGDEAPADRGVSADDISFSAVAVTREAVVAVGLFTAVVLGIPGWALVNVLVAAPTNDGHVASEMSPLFFLAYIAFTGLGAFAFRRASRVEVGVDGVHVHGTSRSRFFAYRDLESARVNGSDLELVRRGKAVLRLQLHGDDAARRDGVLARVSENIARAHEGRGAVAAQVVAASSKDDLARVAGGGGDYRAATLTREQLWALVEGPEIEASARKAAAEALVRTSDDSERARLRVAAEHCAEPTVRIALQELAGEDVDPPDHGATRAHPPVGSR